MPRSVQHRPKTSTCRSRGRGRRLSPGTGARVSIPGVIVAVVLAAWPLADPVHLGAEVRWGLWPSTYYDSAEILLVNEEPVEMEVRLTGPDFEATASLPPEGTGRVALPVEGRRRATGLHPGAAFRIQAPGSFQAFLQAPATRDVPDSTLWTSHDLVRLPSEEESGRAYRALAWPSEGRCFGAFGGEPCSDSWLAAVVLRDGTELRIEGAACAAPPPPPSLRAGDVLMVRCRGAGEDVTGSRVSGTAPFVLFSGAVAARTPVDGGSADNLLAAPWPEEGWGTSYFVQGVPGDPFFAAEGDLVRITGDPGRLVTIEDGVLRSDRLIGGGGVLDVDQGAWSGNSLRITASGPVQVGQLLKSRNHRGRGDPSLAVLAPSGAAGRVLSWVLPDGYGEGYLLGVTAPRGARVRLDGGPPMALDPLPGGTHGAVRVELPPPARGGLASHRLVSDAPLSAWVAGQGLYKSFLVVPGRRLPLRVLRGPRPDDLDTVARDPLSPWDDETSVPSDVSLLYYRVEGTELLLMTRTPQGLPRLHF